MNYPVWAPGFGAPLLIAVVAVVHVFVSHFAVGGGLFLVLAERKAYREGDPGFLAWLRSHSRFFVLLTVVFGAVSGVGIWFTIGLIHPSATSTLIHAYVWGWAIEWIFFFLEITSALLYWYGWDRVGKETHLRIGWIYFWAAFMSMVVINGIITFMLTPGGWIESRGFWTGFFNPTYFPSLAFRILLAIALAGVYALLTAQWVKEEALKEKVVRWSTGWILPALVVLPAAAFWYVKSLPAAAWARAEGAMPTASRYAALILVFTGAAFLLAVVARLYRGRLVLPLAVLLFAASFGSMGSFEFIREAVRKPYVIYDYMYSNGIYKEPQPGDGGLNPGALNAEGVLDSAKWTLADLPATADPAVKGRALFRLQCLCCHSLDGYRSVKALLLKKKWKKETLRTRLKSLDLMFGRVMPPFMGTETEREALAAYLADLAPVPETGGKGILQAPEKVSTALTAADGEKVFVQVCEDCHERDPEDPLYERFSGLEVEKIAELIKDLPALYEDMPPFEGTDAEREALAQWLHEAVNLKRGAQTKGRTP